MSKSSDFEKLLLNLLGWAIQCIVVYILLYNALYIAYRFYSIEGLV